MAAPTADQDALYGRLAASYGAALERLAGGYESDSDKRRDLLQDIHLALWRSLDHFAGRCSLRTWVYRVAHNTAISHISRRRARAPALVSLDEVATLADGGDAASALDRRLALDRLYTLVQRLTVVDRQVILLYLEDLDAASIGEIVGLSPSNVATKVHRIKEVLSHRFHGRTR